MVTEIKEGGRRVESEKKVFPGYVLVRMELDDRSWACLLYTSGTYLNWKFVAKRLRKYSVVAGDSITLPEFYSKRFQMCIRDRRMGIARGVDMDAPAAPIRSDLGSTADMSTGAPAVIAKAHHGSVSKEKRLQVEREDVYKRQAQVAMGAKPAQTIKAIAEAEAYPGPSLIIGYSPCEMHSIKGGMAHCQDEMKKAVDCGYWNQMCIRDSAEPRASGHARQP